MADDENPVVNPEEQAAHYTSAIHAFARGYNKGIVLSSVTRHSLEILDDSMTGIESGLSTIVAAFEEIRATSGSTAVNAERIESMMHDVLGGNENLDAGISARVEDVNHGVSVARDLGAMFTSLKEKTAGVATITDAIQDVSDRTNILAINASIEAARAGSVGKGFRIIANEVRALAGQTGDFAKQIESSIGELSNAVGAIASRMDEFVALFTRFRDSFDEVGANSAENAASVRQASQFLAQIAGAIKEETMALGDGLDSLEAITAGARDTHAVFAALRASHDYLDTLLDRKS
ncbi:MAG: methyl-accepting chemotaxis protein [Spirochaetales bacterium]|nr:methyl-accepting chemotaxis protein [Spirochaetales bacterium]